MIDYFGPRGEQLARVRPSKPWVWWASVDIVWMIVGVVALYSLTLLIKAALAPAPGYPSPLLALLLLVALAMLARNTRRGRALLALGYLEQAVRLNLPLPQMLAAAGAAERGVVRRRLARLRERIESGAPVATALQQALPSLPPRVVALAQCGERLGRLPQALQRALRQERLSAASGPAQAIFLRWYPVAMLVSLATIGGAVVKFLIPMYHDFFREAHQSMPAVTEWMAACWETFQAPVAIMALVILAVYCGRMVSEVVQVRRPRFGPWRPIIDRLAWITPLWRGSVRNRGLADVCFVLADALDAGQPIDSALLESADAANNVVLRNRVNRWAQLMSGGADVAQAARAARMPAILWGMLAAARGPEGTRNVLLFLGRYYDTRFNAAGALLRAAAVPIMVGITATLVTIIALGVFMPMIRLAEVLMQPRGVL